VKAEEFLAELQADSEIATSVGGLGTTGLSDEEQALFEELEREAETERGGPSTTQVRLETTETPEERAEERARHPVNESDEEPPTPAAAKQPRRTEPEPG